MRLIFRIACLLSLFCINVFSQNQQRIVSGKVTDFATGEPIPMASVFIANTTKGTTTDSEGNFHLSIPGQGSYDLIVSHVGYHPEFNKARTDRATVRMDVKLKTRELKETVVSTKVKARKEDISLFWKMILGTEPSKMHVIQNPKDIFYFFNSKTNQLKVSCPVPIQMINLETGYQIHYVLRSFSHNYQTNRSSWSGQALFRELPPKNQRQKLLWETNRQKIYSASITHFLRAWYHDRLLEEGYSLNFIEKADQGTTTISSPIPGRDFLVVDSIAGCKLFRNPQQANLLLTCFGNPVTDRDIQDQQKDFEQAGLFRIFIRSQNGDIQIFPDGTYTNYLQLDRHISSRPIAGLNMMLPLEYGLQEIPTDIEIATPHQVQNILDMDSLVQMKYPEKLYLTTDRTCYAAGDTVWISAWVLNGSTLYPSDKSRMLHVELLHPEGSVLQHLILEAFQGIAFGQLVLPKAISNNTQFCIRAYTRWSLNFNESYRFEKPIFVIQPRNGVWRGPKKTEKIVTSDVLRVTEQVTDPLVTRNLSLVTGIDLQFLPEGGRWVAGVPCRLAFRAVAADGRGKNVEGKIIDNKNEFVAGFRSLHQGMGLVSFIPQPGLSYRACLQGGHIVNLPVPETTGIVMNLQSTSNDSLDVKLYFPQEVINEKFYLAAQSAGIYVTAWEIPVNSKYEVIRIPTERLNTGIANFTLLNKNGVACNARSVFIDKGDRINIGVSAKEDNGLMKLSVHAHDTIGFPVQGVFTVAVTDSLYGNCRVKGVNILSQMLLSADLSGKVENPGWYFEKSDSLRKEALDLVMLTHGWNGYSWENYRSWDKMDLQFLPELDYQISGFVGNTRTKKGVEGVPVSLWMEGIQNMVKDTLTDLQGRFSFDRLLPLENAHAFVQIIRNKKQKGNLKLDLDDQPGIPSPTTHAWKTDWTDTIAVNYQRKQIDQYWPDNMTYQADSMMYQYIEEVIVEGKRSVKGSRNLNGPGQADKVLYPEDISRYDRLLDILKVEFPQMQPISWKKDELLWELNRSRLKLDQERSLNKLEDLSLQQRIAFDYPIWRSRDKTVLFVLNGRVLPVGLPANDTVFSSAHHVTDSLSLIARNFWNIPAKDITGIEMMESVKFVKAYSTHVTIMYYNAVLHRVLSSYYNDPTDPVKMAEYVNLQNLTTRKLDARYSPCIIEITTYSGSSNLERSKTVTNRLSLQGFTIPKAFYIPKYYPENIAGQAEYDVKPTLYWNPEVVTDKDGKAEIQFPVGLKPRGLQIQIEGTDLRGRIGSTLQGINTGKDIN